jgi:hypothetical protein
VGAQEALKPSTTCRANRRSIFAFGAAHNSAESGMADLIGEIESTRLDIETLRTMIDLALDNGIGGEDPLLRACADVLYERRTRLEQLERAGT